MPDDVVADAVLLPLSLFGVIKRALMCSSPDRLHVVVRNSRQFMRHAGYTIFRLFIIGVIAFKLRNLFRMTIRDLTSQMSATIFN
ncbi:hypothetical protein D934_06925 [Xylella fastidiosa subsp. sandyi Ann-1]|uniref:Uncharacterized protein n=1 Tax=Xylella fastidiosa subsp. sandyi Ann-1 TaxID=155920 RepID=A0A060HE77_XYLFS|nr:hypothetical protein D934_06925 [Xylella fastidiosa subsp. sandyi Ann-1]